MSNISEGKVKKAVKDTLNTFGAYYHMPVQNGMGQPTLDFVGCYEGLFFAIETKAPKKKMTPRQLLTQRKMEDAGGKVFMVDSTEGGTLDILIRWLIENGD
jgi:penicillin-binding protein-related factor A (putative recombinase)